MREEEPGAVASDQVDLPTDAAELRIILLPDTGNDDDSRENKHRKIPAFLASLRRTTRPL